MATTDQNTSTASHTSTTSHVLISSHISTTSDPNHLLCQDHQGWDDIPGVILDADGWNWSRPINWYPRRFAPTTHAMDELCRNSQCLICASTAAAVTTHIQNRDRRLQTWPLTKIEVTLVLLDTPAENMSHRTDSAKETEYLVRTMLGVAFEPHESVTNGMSWTMEMRLCLRFITTPGAPGEGKLFSIEPCEIPFFFPSLLRSWIQTCDTVHGSNCGAMHSEETGTSESIFSLIHFPNNMLTTLRQVLSVFDFRVIDVVAMQVLRPIESVRFVALSYMWPKGMENNSCFRLETQSLGSLEAPGGLRNLRLPPVISDAISLSRDLGERYLWVDRLCIVQDDAQSKHHQICAMDKVYSLATFTIIAALNDTEARVFLAFEAILDNRGTVIQHGNSRLLRRGCQSAPMACRLSLTTHFGIDGDGPSKNVSCRGGACSLQKPKLYSSVAEAKSTRKSHITTYTRKRPRKPPFRFQLSPSYHIRKAHGFQCSVWIGKRPCQRILLGSRTIQQGDLLSKTTFSTLSLAWEMCSRGCGTQAQCYLGFRKITFPRPWSGAVLDRRFAGKLKHYTAAPLFPLGAGPRL